MYCPPEVDIAVAAVVALMVLWRQSRLEVLSALSPH